MPGSGPDLSLIVCKIVSILIPGKISHIRNNYGLTGYHDITSEMRVHMNEYQLNSKGWEIAVIVSWLLFITLHNSNTYFGTGAPIFVFLRYALILPLLWFFYKGSAWAKVTLTSFSTLLAVVGSILFLLFFYKFQSLIDMAYLGTMLLCMIVSSVLLWSNRVRVRVNS